MNNSIYPVLGVQMKLPFYVSGVGISDPEYHVVRSSGLVSYQILYTRSGAGVLEIDAGSSRKFRGAYFSSLRESRTSTTRSRACGRPPGWFSAEPAFAIL